MNSIIKNKFADIELSKVYEKLGIYSLIITGAGTAIYLACDKAFKYGYNISADLKNLKFKFYK